MRTLNVKYNNGAGRILSILENAVEVGKANPAVRKVWSEVFGLDEKATDLREYFRRFVDLSMQLDRVEEQLRHVKGDKASVYLRAFPPIRHAFCPVAFNQTWKEANPKLDDAVLTALELCAVELPEEGTIPPEEISAVQQALQDLSERIRVSTIPDALKKWLLDLVSSAKRSIDLYEILGAYAFNDALRGLCGDLATHLNVIDDVKSKDESIYTQLMSVLNSIKELAQRAKEWEPLLEYTGAIVLQLPGLTT
jgi:hypothetical protein